MTFWGPNGIFLGSGCGSKTVLGSTHVVEEISFSMLPSIQTFDFELIFVLFFTFLGPNVLFLGSGYGSKTVSWSKNVDEQLSFSMFPSI